MGQHGGGKRGVFVTYRVIGFMFGGGTMTRLIKVRAKYVRIYLTDKLIYRPDYRLAC
jgi:hypothetical protein